MPLAVRVQNLMLVSSRVQLRFELKNRGQYVKVETHRHPLQNELPNLILQFRASVLMRWQSERGGVDIRTVFIDSPPE